MREHWLPIRGSSVAYHPLSTSTGEGGFDARKSRCAAGSDCPHGSFCIWEDSDYRGRELSVSGCGFFHDLPNGSPAYSAEPHADWQAVWFLRNNC